MSSRPLELGPLELQVLDDLWARDEAATVRDVHQAFAGLAYTTVMTTLDRLHRKGLLERWPRGRAFAYRARASREEVLARMAAEGIVSLLPATGSSRPVLSMLVDAVGRRDAALLDELEALVRAARERHRDGEPS